MTLDGGNWDTLDPLMTANKVCLTPVDDNVINPKDPRCAMKNQDIFGNGPDDRQVCGDYLQPRESQREQRRRRLQQHDQLQRQRAELRR